MLKRHEVLFQQLTDYRNELLELVNGITEDMADTIPAGFNNSIRWNLGHIYLDQFLWIQHLTKEKLPIPEGFKEWFGFGTSPITWQSAPPSISIICKLLKEQIPIIQEQFSHRLEEEYPTTESGMHTISQVLVRTIWHEGMHFETIKNIKRFL